MTAPAAPAFGSASTRTRQSAKVRLGRLRKRLTTTFAIVAVAGIASLAVATTIIDGRLRADRFDAELQGQASRAAALVFLDEDGRWNVAGVIDDVVAQTADGIMIYDAIGGSPLFTSGQLDDVDPIIDRVLADAAEVGVIGSVLVDGQRLPAAGSPYFGDGPSGEVDVVVGAVIVAGAHTADADRRWLVGLVWSAAAALGMLAALMAWLVAGRVVRPMAEELDREEAFLATAAHELRTPLGRFRAVTDSALLASGELSASPARDEVINHLRRLNQLNDETTRSIEDLLLVGRIEAGQLAARSEAVRLDELVAGFEATVPELVVDSGEPVLIDADQVLVRHALSNLFINAQRHARQADRPLMIQAKVHNEVGNEGWDAVVTVSDNGPGLAIGGSQSNADLDAVFTKHQTSTSSGGLGLWIVRAVVEAQAGTVSAGSNPEGGAVFELRWPASRPR